MLGFVSYRAWTCLIRSPVYPGGVFHTRYWNGAILGPAVVPGNLADRLLPLSEYTGDTYFRATCQWHFKTKQRWGSKLKNIAYCRPLIVVRYIYTASFEFKWAMRLEFIIKLAKYILGMLCIRYLQSMPFVANCLGTKRCVIYVTAYSLFRQVCFLKDIRHIGIGCSCNLRHDAC